MELRVKLPILALLIVGLLSGCSSKQSKNNDKDQGTSSAEISKSQMKKYYKNIFDSYADVIDSYADSIKDNKLETASSASHTIELIDNTNVKLKNNSINKEESNNFVKLNEGLEDLVECYKTNDFSHSKEYNSKINKYLPKVKNDLRVGGNNKLTKATKRLNEVAANSPHVKGQTAFTTNEKIEITGSQIAPGFRGGKVLIVFYTATNLSEEPKEAFDLLLDSGEFEQDNGDSYSESEVGLLDSDWEEAHPDIMNLNKQGSDNKIKQGASLNAVTYYDLANDTNPLLYRVTDSVTGQKLGTIKIPLNN